VSMRANWRLTPEMRAMAEGRRVLVAPKDFAVVLAQAFAPDAMFDTAITPDAVCARLREEILANKAVGIAVDGPHFVDGDLRLTLSGGATTTVTVHPEGGYDVAEEAP